MRPAERDAVRGSTMPGKPVHGIDERPPDSSAASIEGPSGSTRTHDRRVLARHRRHRRRSPRAERHVHRIDGIRQWPADCKEQRRSSGRDGTRRYGMALAGQIFTLPQQATRRPTLCECPPGERPLQQPGELLAKRWEPSTTKRFDEVLWRPRWPGLLAGDAADRCRDLGRVLGQQFAQIRVGSDHAHA